MSRYRFPFRGGGEIQMANGRNYRGNVPKRRIEKVWCRLGRTVSTSISTADLHTVEDMKTLVRMRVEFDVAALTGAPNYDINISVAPHDTTIAGCSTSEVLDQDSSKHTLFRKAGVFQSGNLNATFIEFDSKAMRKLQPGDVLKFQSKCDVTNGVYIRGYVTMWFKE